MPLRAYAFRLYPNRIQTESLEAMLGVFCDLYNAGLEERISAYAKGVYRSYLDQANQLKEARREVPDLAIYSYSAEQQVLRRLDKAFRAFFRRCKEGKAKAGFPRFRSRRRFDSADFRVGDGLRIKDGRLLMVGIPGAIKVKWHRDLQGIPKAAVVRRQAGHWSVTVQCDVPATTPAPRPVAPTGVDLGLSAIVALADGTIIEARPFARESERKKRRLQRAVARKERYSRRRRKAVQNLARHSRKVANRRRDFLHKLSRRLADTYTHIAFEDLNITGLSRGMLAKSVYNAAWATLVQFTTFKAEEAGGVVVLVDPRGTSQACSGCGTVVPKGLSVRVHRCDCGLEIDRDVNAARNVLALSGFPGPGSGLQAQSTSVGTRLA